MKFTLRQLRGMKDSNTLVSLLGGTSLVLASAVAAVDTVYTNDADFDNGSLQSVNFDAPNSNQLQVSDTIQTLPVLYVANAGEDTVSKIDTDDDCEVARYRTWFAPNFVHSAWTGPAPSRSAVDVEGNVYVANRHFDGRPASLIKILAEGFVDRNGNGVIDTSVDADGNCQIDASEIIALVDTNANGILEDAELADERVAWIRQVGPNSGLGRSVCIDPNDGNIWLGLYNSFRYYKLDPDGNILDADGSGPNGYVATNFRPYGCVVDSNSNLFSATLSGIMGVINNNVNPPVATNLNSGIRNYGISLGNGFVYLGEARPYRKYEIPSNPLMPTTGTFSTPTDASNPNYANRNFAVSVDGNGDVVQGYSAVAKYDGATDEQLWFTSNPVGSDYRGVIPDANQDIWRINLSASSVSKFDGENGNLLTVLPVGANPYTYSDASGSTLAITNPTGRWTVTTDGGEVDAVWDEIRWNDEPQGSEPTGTSIEVEARAANTIAGLSSQVYTPVSNGGDPGLVGRYLETRALLRPSSAASPVLSDLAVSTVDNVLRCDVNLDGFVDIGDIRAIAVARNAPATGPDDVRDNDGDGTITANDARQCVLQCSFSRCAPATL